MAAINDECLKHFFGGERYGGKEKIERPACDGLADWLYEGAHCQCPCHRMLMVVKPPLDFQQNPVEFINEESK